MITLQTLVSDSVFQENTYFVIDGREMLIIDPGSEPDAIERFINDSQALPLAVLATHGHPDHIISAEPVCRQYGIPFIMSSLDVKWLDELKNMCSRFRLNYHGTPSISKDCSGLDRLTVGSWEISVFHTPGHSRGGVCYLIDKNLFSGDTLFAGGVGRTDLPGGDMPELKNSIRNEIYPLEDDVIVCPGHMSRTDIGTEKRSNPFFQPRKN